MGFSVLSENLWTPFCCFFFVFTVFATAALVTAICQPARSYNIQKALSFVEDELFYMER